MKDIADEAPMEEVEKAIAALRKHWKQIRKARYMFLAIYFPIGLTL